MRWILTIGLVSLSFASPAVAQDKDYDWREEAAKWWSLYDPDSFEQYGQHLWDHDWNKWAQGWKEGDGKGCPWKDMWGGDWQKWGDWGNWGDRGEKRSGNRNRRGR